MHRFGLGIVLALAAFAGVFAVGCAMPSGPHVRVATVTPAELATAQKADMVWYEFQPGDVVPVHFGFIGAPEGGTEQPAVLRAKRKFFLVMRKDLPMEISFDGESFAQATSSQSIIAIVPRKDGSAGAEVGWIHYIGESGDPESELKSLIEQEKAPPAKASTASAAAR